MELAIPNPADNPVLTVEQAAVILGIGRATAYRAANDGSLPTIRVGKRLLVPTAALRRMLHLDEHEVVTR